MSDQPRLLDLFCRKGGATKGYQKAGQPVALMGLRLRESEGLMPGWLRRELRLLRRRPLRQTGWAVQNWWKGYRFAPIQRCRWCDHTTPYHYNTCRTKAPADA